MDKKAFCDANPLFHQENWFQITGLGRICPWKCSRLSLSTFKICNKMAEKQKILIVEDNDFVRMQIVRYLKDAGYETQEAKDGAEALHIMGADTALAIVDLRMEPMGGLDFVRALRGKELDTPVVFVTGDDNNDLLEQAAKWDVAAVLMKPVMKDRLVNTVQRVMITRSRA